MNVTPPLATYGDFAVLLFITIESTDIPFPGETMLLIAAIAAGTTHQLSIPLVIVAAASGAILDRAQRWILSRAPLWPLRSPGRAQTQTRPVPLPAPHGGKVVFFGRFITVLRAWAAFLAGTNQMRWSRFPLFNAASRNRVGQPGGTGRLLGP